MDRYVAQLLQDIRAAQRSLPEPPDPDDEWLAADTSPEEAATYARWVILGDHLGLPFVLFPPASRLREGHLMRLLSALELVIRGHRLRIEYPLGADLGRRYDLLRIQLRESIPLLPYHTWTLQVCQHPQHACPLGHEYCDCLLGTLFSPEDENWSPDSRDFDNSQSLDDDNPPGPLPPK
ncbi:MAG: hypothetical protein KDC54_03300 [Lewinella sp.]|nr:hypothetical protein [Lewinella sp.]